MQISRCTGCMEKIDSYPCPHCGYDPQAQEVPIGVLRPQTILNGKYLVGRVLGQGGFGITYLGFDLALDIKIAIKEYFPKGQAVRLNVTGNMVIWGNDAAAQRKKREGMEGFLREARKMARITDIPNVVNIRDVFTENGTAYLVMEFVEGETLSAYLNRTGPISWGHAREIFLPAVTAMEQVHTAGLIHRDISPDNLMLLPDGRVKILDLGAAKDLTVNSGASSMVVAKHGFSPMEQYTQRGSSGPWTDVYAMAATIYYALTGTIPQNSIDRVENDTIDWNSPSLAAIPPKALSALKSAMEVTARKRMSDMHSLKAALLEERSVSVPKEKRFPALGILAVCAAALLAVCLLLLRTRQDAVTQAVLPAPEKPTSAAAASVPETVSPTVPSTVPSTTEPLPDPFELAQAHVEDLWLQNADADALRFADDCRHEHPGEKQYETLYEQSRQHLTENAIEQAKADMSAGRPRQAILELTQALELVDSPDCEAAILDCKQQMARHTLAAAKEHTGIVTAQNTLEVRGDRENYSQADVAGWSNIAAVSMGDRHVVALCSNGTLLAAGDNRHGQCDVRSWTDITQISCGDVHTAALTGSGEVKLTAFCTWDYNVSDLYTGSPIIALAAGYHHTAALHADGTVTATGANDYGQCNVSGWTDIIAIYAGSEHTVGLKLDGTVVATGDNTFGQCNTSGWQNIERVSCGDYFTLGLRSDGTVVAVGQNKHGQINTSSWENAADIAAGHAHSVVRTASGQYLTQGNLDANDSIDP